MRSMSRVLLTTMMFLMREGMVAQMPFEHSVSLSAGAYAASGFGTNLYYSARYNYFIEGGKFFAEGGLGFGSLKSDVLGSVTKAQVYESERVVAYEFVGGFDPYPNGYVPYVIGGVAGLKYGGQSNFAGVIGLGKRVPLKGLFGGNQFGIRYDVRDQIFSQTIYNAAPFTTHNIVFTVGLQYYF